MKRFALPLLATMIASGAAAQNDAASVQASSWVSASSHSPAAGYWADSTSDAYNAVIERYCSRCHGERRQRGNLSLADFDTGAPQNNPAVAEKMIRKLRAEMMPPAGQRRPEGDTLLAMVTALETQMDAAAALDPNPGRRTFQRLNRAEYTASVRDLLELEIDVANFLPLDTKSANFDNIADVQMPSATLMEGYLRAAGAISRMAVGDTEADPSSTTYRTSRTASQKERVEGAPFGTRGGVSAVHNFPADGKYVFQVIPHPSPEGELFGRTSLNEQIEVSIDGERVALIPIDRWMTEAENAGMTITTDTIDIRGGAHRVTAAFIRTFEGVEDDLIRPVDNTLADTQIGLGYGVTTLPHLQRLAIVGPFEITGVSDSPSRRNIFTCRPTAPEEARPCARDILARLASKAYRRTATGGDTDALLRFYDEGSLNGGFEVGIRTAIQALLASPHFVFRMEEAQGTGSGVYRISDVDLASRLSFFMWGSPPDEALIGAANQGELSRPAVLDAQVRRMLEDPRSEGLAARFAAQWLRLPDLQKVDPDALTYPYFDRTLSDAMRRETELLFIHLIREDASVLDLLTADYTFVNERLARHYGIPNVTGSGFQRVAYPDDKRRGILGHGSILTLTSHADRTSPVLRGKWVLEVLLGSPPPPPPPDVPELEATEGAEDGRFLTVREQMEIHRANAACQSCHVVMDPIGLALENFDVTGAWRIRDRGNPIDPVGELYDGTAINGPADLRAALLKRPEVLLRNFTENLMAYGLGRRVEYYDMPSVRAITRDAAANGYRISSFVLGVVNSPAFQMTRADQATEEIDENNHN